MKILLLTCVGAVLLNAQNTRTAPAATEKTAATVIPQSAVQVQPYLYRYTDAQGRRWMYRQTPFGISKWEEKETAAPAPESLEPIITTDLGDSVRFSHKYPFGEQVWIRKKSELTEEDKAIIERNRQPKRASASIEERR